jgi:hypothetical protein
MGASQILKTITPDWEFSGTIERIKEEFSGFLVTGPGWYSKQGTWILAMAAQAAGTYSLWVFFDRDPRETFRSLAIAPVKLHVKDKV